MHHTKVKADMGLAKVIADLVEKGHVPCVPLSEHQPYDLVAVLKNGDTVRIQVKYSSITKSGVVEVNFRTSWADKNGTHIKHYKKEDFDYYAIYCPEKDKVVYVSNTTNCPKSIRFEKTANNQRKFVSWANDHLDIGRESSETKRRTPEMVKT